MTTQKWNAELYEKNARFVSDLGAPVLELLGARAGEDILDLGCGDGSLTQKIAGRGCRVVGLDSSPELVAAARQRGVQVIEESATQMDFVARFDAVFSNAALHWMKRADLVIANVARALRPKGRFVAEMGGAGCVQTVLAAMIEELAHRGQDGGALNPWYFPSAEDYATRLTAAGFEVRYIALIPRPTLLPGDLLGWLDTFSGAFTAALPPAERPNFLKNVRARLAPRLCDANGRWTVDYVRLRFAAHLG